MTAFDVRIAVSNSHAHLSSEHARILFGSDEFPGAGALDHAKFRKATQTVTVRGRKGSLDLRVLAPCTQETWVELSSTHAHALGVHPPLEEGSLPEQHVTLAGPRGQIDVAKNVVIEARHLEVTRDEAARWQLTDGQVVAAEIAGPRALVFRNVKVRILSEARDGFEGCLEIDRDEANAAFVQHGDRARIVTLDR